jgi:predicted dienelactone hydrolase
VEVLNQAWHDPARDRDVPATIYYPKDANGPCPVILFSHGLGGSNELYSYLGRCWAGRGYVAVHLDHRGSDTLAILAGGITKVGQTGRKIATDPQNAINRAQDVSFAIDRLTKLNADETWPLHGRIDLEKIGLAGHSFGGNTAMIMPIAAARLR